VGVLSKTGSRNKKRKPKKKKTNPFLLLKAAPKESAPIT
jgi:hypothetical protein